MQKKLIVVLITLIYFSFTLFCSEKAEEYFKTAENYKEKNQLVYALNYYWLSMEEGIDDKDTRSYEEFINLQKIISEVDDEDTWKSIYLDFKKYYHEFIPFKIKCENFIEAYKSKDKNIYVITCDFSYSEVYRYLEISDFLQHAFNNSSVINLNPEWIIEDIKLAKVDFINVKDNSIVGKSKSFASNKNYKIEISKLKNEEKDLLLNYDYETTAVDKNKKEFAKSLGNKNLLSIYKEKMATKVLEEENPVKLEEEAAVIIEEDINETIEENSFEDYLEIADDEIESEEKIDNKKKIKKEFVPPFNNFKEFRLASYKLALQSNGGVYVTNEKVLSDISITGYVTMLPFFYIFAKWDFGIDNKWQDFNYEMSEENITIKYIPTINVFIGPGFYVPITKSIKSYVNVGFAPFIFDNFRRLKCFQISTGCDFYPLPLKEFYLEADVSYTNCLIGNMKGFSFTVGIGGNIAPQVFKK